MQAGDYINTILLVGAGALGSRHLQSLVAHKANDLERHVYVYDPSVAALNMARQRVEEVDQAANVFVYYSDNLNFTINSFDVAIVATSASVRLAAIKSIIAVYKIDYFVLEKILFQSQSVLDEARSFLNDNAKGVWVNCPRRYFPSYKKLANLYHDATAIHMSVSGNLWGMACNTIHFIDLWFFLAKISSYSISLSNVSPFIFDSKRIGFKEVSGKISCSSGSNQLDLDCTNDPSLPFSIKVKIRSNKYTTYVDEIERTVDTIDLYTNKNTSDDFLMMNQSEMSGLVVDEILLSGDCSLAGFNESYSIHSAFLEEFLMFFKKNLPSRIELCPIT
ncbi:MAG: hypothetical protein ACRBCI_14560 [Cellvibrionaceae bacterium]